MNEYEFTLKFSLQGASLDPHDYVDALFESGCDDALIGSGTGGIIALDFTREADSAADAVSSALQNVKAAIPHAKLIEASPDLVGLTDIAAILGCSRQNIRQIMNRHMDTFPSPVHEGGKSAIWHLFPILDWAKTSQKYDIDDAHAELADMLMMVNAAKEASGYCGREEMRQVFALVS